MLSLSHVHRDYKNIEITIKDIPEGFAVNMCIT